MPTPLPSRLTGVAAVRVSLGSFESSVQAPPPVVTETIVYLSCDGALQPLGYSQVGRPVLGPAARGCQALGPLGVGLQTARAPERPEALAHVRTGSHSRFGACLAGTPEWRLLLEQLL